jgi:hypothetical protein
MSIIPLLKITFPIQRFWLQIPATAGRFEVIDFMPRYRKLDGKAIIHTSNLFGYIKHLQERRCLKLRTIQNWNMPKQAFTII